MSEIVLGVDVGTSGARIVALGKDGTVRAQSAAPLVRFGVNPRDPAVWWEAVSWCLRDCLEKVPGEAVRAIAVDGTSGTVLPVDRNGDPLAEPLMYNDRADAGIVQRIAPMIPPHSAAHGVTSGLAKMISFQPVAGIAQAIHQADWIAGRFGGRFDLTDENNALKSGYDPVARRWPEWMAETGLDLDVLPEVREPGSAFGSIDERVATDFGLSSDVLIVAGTTDGCASFLATGAVDVGDGVTALGSTLTLKLLSDRPIFAPEFGIYSHRLLGMWLAGGASNTGGKVLMRHFSRDALRTLSERIDPSILSGLDYYPLLEPGERFPVTDPGLAPRLEPKPDDESLFLKGMLEGISVIEKTGYATLAQLGAPPLRTLRTVGGGSSNGQWMEIRRRMLGVPFLPSRSDEAAAGVATLALAGARKAGML